MSDQPTQINLACAEAFTLGPVRVSPPTLEVFIGERREVFEPRVMQVFVALARRRGEVVSRDELIRDCWDNRAVGDDAISRCVARIRRLSEAEGGFTLETIPRVGYRLAEFATPVAEPHLEPSGMRAIWAHVPFRLRLAAAAIGGLVVLAVGGAWLSVPSHPVETVKSERVAVLPFDILSAGDDVRFFGDAVAEQIIGVLSENQVQVVSRAKSAALRAAGQADASHKLGAEFILDGSVQRGGNGLHVMVHLDHRTTTLWSESYDQDGVEPLALQAQVAAGAVGQMRSALKAWRGGLRDDAALSAYLLSEEFARVGGETAGLKRRELLRKVVAKAPNFSLGHSGLAVASALLLQFTPAEDPATLRATARQEAARALALDPKNGEAYVALAALIPVRNLLEREAMYRKGLAVDPDEPTLNSSLAALLSDTGRYKEAVELQQKAVILDPLSPRKTAGLAGELANVGRTAEAIAMIERADTLWPRNPGVWVTRLYILIATNHFNEARALLEAPDSAPKELRPALSGLRTYVGALQNPSPRTTADAAREAQSFLGEHRIEPSAAVEVLARLGQTDAAFTAANDLISQEEAESKAFDSELLFRPTTAPLRADPRFYDLVRRLGLLDLWKMPGRMPDFCASEKIAWCAELRKA